MLYASGKLLQNHQVFGLLHWTSTLTFNNSLNIHSRLLKTSQMIDKYLNYECYDQQRQISNGYSFHVMAKLIEYHDMIESMRSTSTLTWHISLNIQTRLVKLPQIIKRDLNFTRNLFTSTKVKQWRCYIDSKSTEHPGPADQFHSF